MNCPCKSGFLYEKCCKTYHEGTEPPLPLALMRSRFAAYAQNIPSYIQKTTHPRSPHFEVNKKKWKAGIEEFSRTTEFIGLDILGVGEEWVYFAAHLKQGSKLFTLIEKSHFEKVNGHWRYLNGEVTIENKN